MQPKRSGSSKNGQRLRHKLIAVVVCAIILVIQLRREPSEQDLILPSPSFPDAPTTTTSHVQRRETQQTSQQISAEEAETLKNAKAELQKYKEEMKAKKKQAARIAKAEEEEKEAMRRKEEELKAKKERESKVLKIRGPAAKKNKQEAVAEGEEEEAAEEEKKSKEEKESKKGAKKNKQEAVAEGEEEEAAEKEKKSKEEKESKKESKKEEAKKESKNESKKEAEKDKNSKKESIKDEKKDSADEAAEKEKEKEATRAKEAYMQSKLDEKRKKSAAENAVKWETVQEPEEIKKDDNTAAAEKQDDNTTVERKVYFMPFGQVDEKDVFSASWLQKTEHFLAMDFDKIHRVEDAALVALRSTENRQRVRMTLDWMDFGIEHLSKWWKILEIFKQEEVYTTTMARFDNYLAGAAAYPVEENPSLKETVAVIAFQPYKSGAKAAEAYNLTLKALVATIESLRRAGMGRVLIVSDGGDNTNQHYAKDAFGVLKQKLGEETKEDESTLSRVGHLEVGYATFDPELAKTPAVDRNVPRAALEGLKQAFSISQQIAKDQRTPEQTEHVKTWLGPSKEDWKQVYLTEPDSILQTRPSTLQQLQEQVESGMVLVPHRFQPIPHEADAPGAPMTWLYLPKEDFPTVTELGTNDACCDMELGPKNKPGLPPNFEYCGGWWYQCHFSKRMTYRPAMKPRMHERIKAYPLIRFATGTHVVSIAGSEHGRPCTPQKNHVCVPKDQK